MYRCRKTNNTCLHIGNVCDGINNCLLEDDELFCDLKDVQCYLSCQCLLYAILCLNISNNNVDTLHLSFYSYLHISYSEIYSWKSLKNSLIPTKIVQVPNNGIKEIFNILPSRNILLFNLGYNFLKNIKRNCLETLYLLKILCIHNNYITFLERHSFYNLTNLTLSNISNNPLKNMPELFKIGSNIDVLYIKNTSFRQVNIKSSNEVDIKFIVTNDYHICCITSLRTLCTAKKPWYISCSDILPKHTIKVFFILIAPLVLFCPKCPSLCLSQMYEINSCLILEPDFKPFLAGRWMTFLQWPWKRWSYQKWCSTLCHVGRRFPQRLHYPAR